MDHYTIERISLKPECRIWVSFLKSRLMPTVHITIVGKERLLLLNSIMKGRKINVGQVIRKEVHKCAQKSSGSLIFPNLITALCLQAGVHLEKNEDVIPNKGAITKKSMARIRKEEALVATPQEQTLASAAPLFMKLQSKTLFELQTLSCLNNIEEKDCDILT